MKIRRAGLGLLVAVVLVAGVPAYAGAAPLATPSLVSRDHVSEGFLFARNGRLVHVFRLDPGMGGDHVGNEALVAYRTSTDDGRTWSEPHRLVDGPYDDRNVAGCLTPDGRAVIVYREYDSARREGLALRASATTDQRALSWSTPSLVSMLSAPGRVALAPSGMAFVPGTGVLGVGYNAAEWSLFTLASADGTRWGLSSGVLAPTPSLRLSESALGYLGDGRVLAVSRQETRDSHGYYAMTSADGGATWSEPARLAAPPVWSSAPHILYVAERGEVYLIAGDRIAKDGDERNRGCAIWVYRSTPARIAADPGDWELCGSVPRPWPSSAALYGYPTSARLSDGRHLVVFTERGEDPDGSERAALFQFVLEDVLGSPAPPSVEATLPGSAVRSGTAFAVTGSVVSSGPGSVEETLCRIERQVPGQSWERVAVATPTPDGAWAATCTAEFSARWRVVAEAPSGHAAGFGPVQIDAVPLLAFPRCSGSVRRNASLLVTTEMSPTLEAGEAPVYAVGYVKTAAGYRRAGLWKADRTYLGNGRSELRVRVRLDRRGLWRIRFVAPASATRATAGSAYRQVTVR